MNKEDRTILIEKYLDGELLGDDLNDFELLLQTDKEFADDYFLQKEIRVALTNKDIHDLREQLNEISKNFEVKKQIARKRKPVLVYSLSAVILVLIISSIFIFDKTYTNYELYEMYYKHYDAGTITRGEEKISTEIQVRALRAYDNSQYNEAIKLFNQIADTSQCFIPKEYFTGLSYMELQRFNDAIKHFENVTLDKQSAFYENAIWYEGLCYLKTNQNQEAIRQFKKLLKSDSFYQKRASEIIEKIE